MRQIPTGYRLLTLLAWPIALTLGGCSTAGHIAMAPVHAASWTVDKMTTSKSEADRNRGRELRKQEEREAKERRQEQQQEHDASAYGY